MVRSRLSGDILLAIPVVLAIALVPRLVGLPSEIGFVAGAPLDKLASAAVALEATVAPDGGGYRFEVVQTQSLRPKSATAPTDVGASEPTSERQLFSRIARGIVSPAGFWSEMRAGPEPDGKPDFERARYLFGALASAGKQYRNDGRGWYPTDLLPGFGLDPRTASRLPELLRHATAPSVTGTGTDAGRPIEKLSATGAVADIPGVIAADGERFTELTEPLEVGLDTAGRLATLRVVARNTNPTGHDLIVETLIRFAYDGVGQLPAPQPAYTPASPDAAALEGTGR